MEGWKAVTTLYTYATRIPDEFVNKNNRTPLAASRPSISVTQFLDQQITITDDIYFHDTD